MREAKTASRDTEDRGPPGPRRDGQGGEGRPRHVMAPWRLGKSGAMGTYPAYAVSRLAHRHRPLLGSRGVCPRSVTRTNLHGGSGSSGLALGAAAPLPGLAKVVAVAQPAGAQRQAGVMPPAARVFPGARGRATPNQGLADTCQRKSGHPTESLKVLRTPRGQSRYQEQWPREGSTVLPSWDTAWHSSRSPDAWLCHQPSPGPEGMMLLAPRCPHS